MPPLSNIKPMHVICKNLIGNNLGNMLFPYSVARTLMCEDVVIDTMTTAKEYSMTEVKGSMKSMIALFFLLQMHFVFLLWKSCAELLL